MKVLKILCSNFFNWPKVARYIINHKMRRCDFVFVDYGSSYDKWYMMIFFCPVLRTIKLIVNYGKCIM